MRGYLQTFAHLCKGAVKDDELRGGRERQEYVRHFL